MLEKMIVQKSWLHQRFKHDGCDLELKTMDFGTYNLFLLLILFHSLFSMLAGIPF